jgi:hypothetical protein
MPSDNQAPGQVYTAQYDSHLFTVRVWQEAVSHNEAEWRGRLQHVPSGQVYYFRSWNELIAHLLSLLPDGGPAPMQLAPDEWVVGQAGREESNHIRHTAGQNDTVGE